MKKPTHPEPVLKSIQNSSSFSSFGRKSCTRKHTEYEYKWQKKIRPFFLFFIFQRVKSKGEKKYLSGTEKGTEAGNSVDPERQNTGNYCNQSSPIYFMLINF